MRRCDRIIRRPLSLLILCLLAASVPQYASGDAAPPDIHELVTEADHIVTASILTLKREAVEGHASLQVTRWVKTQFKKPPEEFTVHGTYLEDSPFGELAEGRAFLIFVFSGNRVDRPFSVIELGDEGQLSSFAINGLAEPLPRTIDDMLAQIRIIMSPAYEDTLLSQLADNTLDNAERSRAATALGYIRSAKAFPILQEWAAKDDAEAYPITEAALRSLYRIDAKRATAALVSVAVSSVEAAHVRTACHLLGLEPSKEPEDFSKLLAACQRWKDKDEAGHEAVAGLISALGSMNQVTPEFKALLLDEIRHGKGNAKHVSMCVAGHLKIEEALPSIRDILAHDPDANMRMSARLALAYYKLPRGTDNDEEEPESDGSKE